MKGVTPLALKAVAAGGLGWRCWLSASHFQRGSARVVVVGGHGVAAARYLPAGASAGRSLNELPAALLIIRPFRHPV